MLYDLIEKTMVAKIFYQATICNYINCSIRRHRPHFNIMSSKRRQGTHFSLNSPVITVSQEVLNMKTVLILSFSNIFRQQLHHPIEVPIRLNDRYKDQKKLQFILRNYYHMYHLMHWCLLYLVQFNVEHGCEHENYVMN